MLRLVEDDPERQRLLLRARPWALAELLRRVVVTALVLALLAVAVRLTWSGLPVVLLLALELCTLGAAWLILRLSSEETAELLVDGPAGLVRARLRGRHIWSGRTLQLRFEGPDRLLRLYAGMVAGHGFRRLELGLCLEEGSFGVEPLRGFGPGFSIEGIDRRDEVEALAEALARRLGVGLTVEVDDAVAYQVRLSRRSSPPPALVQETRGYRDAPRLPGLPRDRAPGFEEPRSLPPALDTRDLALEFREQIVRTSDGRLAMETPGMMLAQAWPTISRIAGAVLGVALVGVAVAWRMGDTPWTGIFVSLAGVLFTIIYVLTLVAVFTAICATASALCYVIVVTLARVVDPRPRWFNTLPLRRWRLATGALAGHALRGFRWQSGEVRAVVLVERERKETSRVRLKIYRWCELHLRTRLGWVRLAQTPEQQAPPTQRLELPPAIVALAVEVARELDAPVRWVP
ncbi:MAG: hypothetical protein H0T76_23200 [Nannocystis sp.]|nr:hypothetical protein [Nannocystis sp.]MBA3549392.1 hypothetical protein [Nannocystis sp.]